MICIDQPATWSERFKNWCHLWSYTCDVEELLAFGDRLGLKREWLQTSNPKFPHFDVSPSNAGKALKLGAVAMPLTGWIQERNNAQEQTIRVELARLRPAPIITDVYCAAPSCWYVSFTALLSRDQVKQLESIGYLSDRTPLNNRYRITRYQVDNID